MVTQPARRPVPDADLDAFAETLRGPLFLPETDDYDDARSVWNATVDRRPALVVRPHGAADVMATVSFARDHGLDLSVKGGGHNVAGNAVCEDGVMLDCAAMDHVRVDPEARTASVGPGARLHDLDAETQAHGLATPAGFVSTTGVAGLTLGGGVGYLSRKHGLTVDNLRAVDLVTADGRLVHASEDRHPDLFWALRGGGGNFGVVTAFEFDLHDLGPTVCAGPVAWAFEDAPAVLRAVADFLASAPRTVSCLPILRRAPPAPFLPEAIHGELVLVVAMCYAGDPEEGRRVLAPLRSVGDPVADAVGPMPYVDFQSLFDGASGPGARNYWKSHYLAALDGAAIDTLCEHVARMTSPESVVGMLSLGGAVAAVDDDATAYPHRDAAWVVNIQSRWHDPDEDDRHVAWARECFDALTPHATGGVYVNFLGAEGDERVRAAYGPATYDRLARVKAEWDPENVFHLNQNVTPASSGST